MAEYLPQKLGQNYVDYIMKQYQTWIDSIFGSENDNGAKTAVEPIVYSGKTAFKVFGTWGGTAGYYWNCTQDVNIQYNNDGNVVSNQFLFPDKTGNQAYANAPMTDWINTQPFACEMWGSYERTSINNGQWFFRSFNYDTAEINANVYLKNSSGTNVFYSEKPTISTGKCYIATNGAVTGSQPPVLGVASSTPNTCTLGCPVVNVPSYSNDDRIVNYDTTNNTYNSFQYTTKQGDTVNIYLDEYGINTGTVGLDISYDDLFSIMVGAIGLLPAEQGSQIVVPTYEEIKYSDMGDFYITPLHQYGKLPTAPTFETSLDLSTYPSTIGSVATRYIDFLPLSISALLAGTVIVSAIVSFIRRDL